MQFFNLNILKVSLSFFQTLTVQNYTVREHENQEIIIQFKAYSMNSSSEGIKYIIIGGDPHADFMINTYTGELLTT